MRLFVTLLFVFVLSIALVSAEYGHVGDNGFNGGSGIFQTGHTFDTNGRSVSDPKVSPLIGDFDNDGTNEILLQDGGSLIMYSDSTLTTKATQSLGYAADPRWISVPYTENIDSDDAIEIITGSIRDKTIDIYEFNGTAFNKQIALNLSVWEDDPAVNVNISNAEMMFACALDDCVVVFNNATSHSGTIGAIFATHFDATKVSSSLSLLELETGGAQHDGICFPSMASMDMAQADSDDNYEFVFTYTTSSTGSSDGEYHHVTGEIDPTLDFVDGTPVDIQTDLNTGICTVNSECDAAPMTNCLQGLSPPTQFAAKNSQELYSGYVRFDDVSSDLWVVELVKPDGTSDTTDAGGIFRNTMTVAGNVVTGKFFPDSPGNDYCGVAFDTTQSELLLTCKGNTAENPNNPLTDSFNYVINISTANVSITNSEAPVLSFAADHNDRAVTGCDSGVTGDIDEIITPYGVYALDFQCDGFLLGACEFGGECDLIQEYSSPYDPGTFISDDIQGNAIDDLFLLTEQQFFHLDSLAADQPASLDNGSFQLNPCRDSSWQTNTTVTVSFNVNDGDAVLKDQVAARVLLYADESNEQEQALGFAVSGSPFNFRFDNNELNKTTGSSILRVLVNDTGTGVEQATDFYYSVANTGIQFGECTEVGISIPTTPISDIVQSAQANLLTGEDNALVDATNELVSVSRLPPIFLWLILFGVTIYSTFTAPALFGKKTSEASHVLMFVLVLETIIFVTGGVLLGIIPVTLIILILLLGSIVAGLWIRNVLQGSNANS